MSLNCFERDQIRHEIEWIESKIASLVPLMARKPSVITQINDLRRQVKEREVSLAFDSYAGRK
jgi:hypothetical protein